MRKRFANWFVLGASLSVSGWLMGQTPLTNLSDEGVKVYPWRTPTTPAATGETSNPMPPLIKGEGETVRFFQAAARQEQDPQTSGAGQFQQDVPNPPSQIPVNPGERQVPLNVQSNALPESYNRRDDGCRIGDPIRLFGQGCNGWTAGGFSQVGYTTDFTFGGFNFEADVLRSHQNWFFVGKEARSGCNWDVGFRVDAVYGTNGLFLQGFGNSGGPSGFDNGWDFGIYGWAMPQLYAEVANCDWRIKAGRFLSPIGYESLPSLENFFFSRTLARTFTEPFTHTGVLAERQVDSRLSVLAGLTLGWDTAFDRNQDGMNLITGLRYQVDRNVRVGVTSSLGDTGYRASGTLTSAWAELQLTDKLCYVVQGDVLNLSGADDLALINGLYYHVNRCLAVGSRFEWWKSDAFSPNSRSSYDATFGLNFRPHANLIIRPEVRTDWGALALDPGDAMYAFDAIIAF